MKKGALVMFSPGHDEVGGAATRSRLFASGLAERGWSVRVVTRNGSLKRFRSHRSGGAYVLEVPGFGLRSLGALLYYLVAIPLGLFWGRNAHALLGLQLFSTATVASVCARVLRKPAIAFSTTSGSLGEANFLRHGPVAWLRRSLLAEVSLLVAQTEQAAEELSRFFPTSRIVVLPNPAEDLIAPVLLGNKSALFTGRFSEEKDLLRLLEVWSSIIAKHPDARLTLAGAGGSFRSIESQLRQRVHSDDLLERSVNFTGWVEDIGPLMSSSDVYIFPSLSEGMSNSLIEACIYGRVVVASDIAANRAVLGEGYPLLFEAGNSKSMEAQLSRAFDDERVRSDALQHLNKERLKFSLEAILDSIEGAIADVAHSPRH